MYMIMPGRMYMTLKVSISSVEWWFYTQYGRKVDFNIEKKIKNH